MGLLHQIDPKTKKPIRKKILFVKSGAVVVVRLQVCLHDNQWMLASWFSVNFTRAKLNQHSAVEFQMVYGLGCMLVFLWLLIRITCM
jgi:hypothetical protein